MKRIEPDVLPYMFDPFYRVATDSDESGLGLVVAKKISDSLGGTIQVLSDGTAGTRVEFSVPNIIIRKK